LVAALLEDTMTPKPQPEKEPLLYDTKGAASVLSVSAGFLEQLRSTGRGPEFIKVEGRGKRSFAVRYTPDALRAWVEQQSNPQVSNG
jgi:hypothetical protein